MVALWTCHLEVPCLFHEIGEEVRLSLCLNALVEAQHSLIRHLGDGEWHIVVQCNEA